MYVNFLSTYSVKKSCHTSTTLQTSIARFVSHIWASCSTTDKYWTISFPCVGRLYVKQCKFNKLTLCRNFDIVLLQWCEANKVYRPKVKDANCRNDREISLKWLVINDAYKNYHTSFHFHFRRTQKWWYVESFWDNTGTLQTTDVMLMAYSQPSI